MKLKIIMTLMVFVNTLAYSQTNKPEIGDFGIHYGVYYNGAVTQQLTFSRVLKKNLEAGLGIAFLMQTNKTTYSDSTAIGTISSAVMGNREVQNQSTFAGVDLNPFLVYHFPVKSNLDIYTGGSVSLGVNINTRDKQTTRTFITDYEQKVTTINYHPLGFNAGAGGILGCQFFFYKNVAIGAQAGLGFNVSLQQGKINTRTEMTNSGSLNPQQGTQVTSDNSSHIKQIETNIGLAGNIGLNLKFYFSRREKAKPVNG